MPHHRLRRPPSDRARPVAPYSPGRRRADSAGADMGLTGCPGRGPGYSILVCPGHSVHGTVAVEPCAPGWPGRGWRVTIAPTWAVGVHRRLQPKGHGRPGRGFVMDMDLAGQVVDIARRVVAGDVHDLP